MHAEWTKLRTVPSTMWLLIVIVVSTIGVGALAVASVNVNHCATPTSCLEDTTKLSLVGVRVGQLVVVVLAVLAMSNEYGTRMVQTTLMANPRRIQVFAARLVVVTALVLAAGVAGVLGSVAAARKILPVNGFAPVSLHDSLTLRAAGGSVLYLGLIALLSAGLAAVLRDTAGSITAVAALLLLAPMVTMLVSHPVWQLRLQRYAPMNAGLAIQATRDLAALPIGAWAGLGVLAAYAGAAVVAGAMLFRFRDA